MFPSIELIIIYLFLALLPFLILEWVVRNAIRDGIRNATAQISRSIDDLTGKVDDLNNTISKMQSAKPSHTNTEDTNLK